jgi:hypothetical protein
MKKVFVIFLTVIIACNSSSKVAKTSSQEIAPNPVIILPEAGNLSSAETDPSLEKATIKNNMTPKRLSEGKKIYIQRCTKCHSMKEPANYTVQQWVPILGKMFVNAKLSDEHDKTLIKNYVIANSK